MTADANGAVSYTYVATEPLVVGSTLALGAFGNDSGVNVSSAVTIAEATLVQAGAETTVPFIAAGLLLAAGVAAVLVARRRATV